MQKLFRRNSLIYFFLSLSFRWLYNLLVWFYHGFSITERGVIHMLMAIVSLLLAWFALQLYRKSSPTGSSLGCLYLIFLVLNFLFSLVAIFFALVKFFSEEGGAETLWLA
jgi:hypothetical protein